MSRRDYRPGEGPVRGFVAAVLVTATLVVVVAGLLFIGGAILAVLG